MAGETVGLANDGNPAGPAAKQKSRSGWFKGKKQEDDVTRSAGRDEGVNAPTGSLSNTVLREDDPDVPNVPDGWNLYL